MEGQSQGRSYAAGRSGRVTVFCRYAPVSIDGSVARGGIERSCIG